MDTKGRNHYLVQLFERKQLLIADDFVITNRGDLMFRTKPDPAMKLEAVACYEQGTWYDVLRADSNGNPLALVLDYSEQELRDTVRRAVRGADKLRGYEMGHGEHHLFDALRDLERLVGAGDEEE